jgi:hypothetical protein
MHQEKEAQLKMSVVVCMHNPREVRFGRVMESLRGSSLASCEDTDLWFTAVGMGCGVGDVRRPGDIHDD